MIKIIKINILVIVLGLMSACASMSPHMTLIKDHPVIKPEPGKALIIFVRPSNYGGAIQATIFDDQTYIGTVSAKTKVAYQATPGKHMFMVVGESADFMRADLMEGKTYYAQVAARMGFWKARFSFIPLNGQVSKAKLNEWLRISTLTKPNELGIDWAKKNQKSIMSKHDSYLIKWNNKKESDKQTLFKNSGQ